VFNAWNFFELTHENKVTVKNKGRINNLAFIVYGFNGNANIILEN